mmetsp:Transcript_8300/g.18544  ORF Transcript_8300/g.18544 Transcript_8300/m.18544 type:complete len:355 (-) Transcript_8300:2490-3554(-)
MRLVPLVLLAKLLRDEVLHFVGLYFVQLASALGRHCHGPILIRRAHDAYCKLGVACFLLPILKWHVLEKRRGKVVFQFAWNKWSVLVCCRGLVVIIIAQELLDRTPNIKQVAFCREVVQERFHMWHIDARRRATRLGARLLRPSHDFLHELRRQAIQLDTRTWHKAPSTQASLHIHFAAGGRHLILLPLLVLFRAALPVVVLVVADRHTYAVVVGIVLRPHIGRLQGGVVLFALHPRAHVLQVHEPFPDEGFGVALIIIDAKPHLWLPNPLPRQLSLHVHHLQVLKASSALNSAIPASVVVVGSQTNLGLLLPTHGLTCTFAPERGYIDMDVWSLQVLPHIGCQRWQNVAQAHE